jgi:hypothetical protein
MAAKSTIICSVYESKATRVLIQETNLVVFLNNLQPDFTCPHERRVGGHGDGPKWTCDLHRLADKADRVVYSIGSEGNYEWEDSLIDEIGSKHCEIHTSLILVTMPGPVIRRRITSTITHGDLRACSQWQTSSLAFLSRDDADAWSRR